MSDSKSSNSDVNSALRYFSLTTQTCCHESDYIYNLLPLCVRAIRFLYRESCHPSEDWNFRKDDIVLVDCSLNFASDQLYGLVVHCTEKTLQIYVNGEFQICRHKTSVVKLRETTFTDIWRDELNQSYIHSIYSIP